MFELDGLLGLLLVALWIHAIIDVIRADESQVRHLPKQTWLFLVLSLPDIGAVVWMAAGRPEQPVARFAEYSARPPRRPRGPEDSPDFAAWNPSDAIVPPKAQKAPKAEDGSRDEPGDGGEPTASA